MEDNLLSDANIPIGMEGGLKAVGLLIRENFIFFTLNPFRYEGPFQPPKRKQSMRLIATLGSNLDSESKLCSDESQSGL